MTTAMRSAYEAAGGVWGLGPSRVYGELALPLLEAAGDVRGVRALDVGTGAGVVACGLAARGARVVASDLAHSMLTHHGGKGPPAVVADVLALPFATGAFDLAAAAFVLNHLTDPADGLRELRRVGRPGASVLATTFDGRPPHPVKTVVDRCAERLGFRAPEWYAEVVRHGFPASSRDALGVAAHDAGLREVAVDRVVVTLDLTPEELVEWRLGMAHLAGFVLGLALAQRQELRAAAVGALSQDNPPLELTVLLLRGRC